MDLQRSYIFIVFIVMIIHEVVFSECDLKTKTDNRRIESYVDGFQRKERQAPIDPSRMYLPPRVDSVASGGFGDQNIDASNNSGDDAAAGYGEVALVQDAAAGDGDGGSSYDVPANTADDGSSSSSSGQKAATERNDFGGYSQRNNDYGGGGSVPGDELLTTAQNRGPIADAPGFGVPPPYGSRVNGDGRDPKRDRAFSAAGRGNAASYGRRDGNAAATSYAQHQPAAGGGDLLTTAQSRGPGNGDGRDPKRDRALSGYGNAAVPATSYGPEGNAAATSYGPPTAAAAGSVESPPPASFTDINDLLLQTGPSAQGAGNGYQYDRDGTTVSAAGYGPSSSGSESNGQGAPRGPDNYGQAAGSATTASLRDGSDAYGPPPARPDGNGANAGRGQPIAPAGLDQSGRGTTSRAFGNYGPTAGSQLSPSHGNGYANGRNTYGPTDARIPPSAGDGYGPNGQNPTANGSPSSTQGSNGSSSGLGRPCHSPGGSSGTRPPNGSRNESQNKKKYSTIVPKAQYQNSNLPSYGDFDKQGNALQNSNNYGGYGEPGPNAFSSFAPGNQLNPPINSNDNNGGYGEPGPNAFSSFAPGNQLNPPINSNDNNGGYGEPGPNAFSSFAPGNQLNPPINSNDNNGGYGEPGPNAFSSFTPGNQLNPPINSNDNNGGYGEPGTNAFSSFAPGNQLDPPINLNDNSNFGNPSPNAFSNFAPGNQLDPPTNLNNNSNFDNPSPNAFSNFAPGNQPNPPINLNDKNGDIGEPSPNAFSNFAPGNQLNSPNNLNNNCVTNNHGVNENKQYESASSASNTGY